ncbi:hypothetical protein Ddye_007005 [Dipteronia dyeriana]|uniref:Reverse transcriptase domain-containing protein n=1 Tax=Dipteronia dyeriana TaxID=168575 RepID=A0AAD9XJG4_9ROSI|nr:hypothetical protein Ddye_007005 [Dipteronia dyeriana]
MCFFCNVYAVNREYGRKALWEFILCAQASLKGHWCLGSDYNTILGSCERLGGVCNMGSLRNFRRFVDLAKDLEESFSNDEVWKALCDCDSNKALGPDVVKDMNHTFVALISKVIKPESLRDYRQISLVGSMYKILMKVLANRLKKIMNLVMDPTQMVFVKDRQIIDNFVIAEWVIHSWKKDKEGGLLLKLDFEKAYNSVDHAFLDSMMSKMGFGSRWRNFD